MRFRKLKALSPWMVAFAAIAGVGCSSPVVGGDASPDIVSMDAALDVVSDTGVCGAARQVMGCLRGAGQPQLGSGMCSLTGTGFVSTRTFTMTSCDSRWYHLGGSFTGNCGGHDGDTYRLLALGPNDCYAY